MTWEISSHASRFERIAVLPTENSNAYNLNLAALHPAHFLLGCWRLMVCTAISVESDTAVSDERNHIKQRKNLVT
jgi:hypothetical protein